MKIIKRDLSEVSFDISKIENAIYKAFISVGDEDKKLLSKRLAEEVFESIWGIDSLGETSTVMVHINRLRAKIDKQFRDEEYIDTVWGVGYRFHKWDNYKKI